MQFVRRCNKSLESSYLLRIISQLLCQFHNLSYHIHIRPVPRSKLINHETGALIATKDIDTDPTKRFFRDYCNPSLLLNHLWFNLYGNIHGKDYRTKKKRKMKRTLPATLFLGNIFTKFSTIEKKKKRS